MIDQVSIDTNHYYAELERQDKIHYRIEDFEIEEKKKILSGDNDDLIQYFYDKASGDEIVNFNKYIINLLATNKTLLNHYLEPYLNGMIEKRIEKNLDHLVNPELFDYDD